MFQLIINKVRSTLAPNGATECQFSLLDAKEFASG